MLFIGGRFTLNKAVLTSLLIYLMSIYKNPVGGLRKMESIRRRFFNGADINENKMSMIGWEKNNGFKEKRRAWYFEFLRSKSCSFIQMDMEVLHRRGVQVSPISCPICCEALENLDHLL
ncbi:hypothetical protein Tco_1207131, partial [Tanacetum coccineum]